MARRTVALVAAMTVVFAGCGGDDGISEEDFQEAATGPCEEFAEEIEKIDDRGLEARDKIEAIEDLHKALEKIEPAADSEEAFAELLEQLDSFPSLVDDLDDAIEDADFDEMDEAIEELEEARTDASETAGTLNLDDCATGLGSEFIQIPGSDEDDDDEEKLSKGDSIDALEDVCGDLEDAAVDLPEPSSNADFPALIELAEESLDNFDEAASALGDINEADEIADDFDDLRDLVGDQIRHFEALLEAAQDEDEGAVEDALDDLQDTTAEAAELMAAMGADNCVD